MVTFQVLSARSKGDYFTGLPPTSAAADGHTHALDDPAEASPKAALHYIHSVRWPEPADGTSAAS